MDASIQQFLLQLPEEKRQLVIKLREVISSVNPQIDEAIKWNGLMFFVGKMHIAFIYNYKRVDYLNLGFMHAVKLSDPKGFFEGTGKGMRHIKVRTAKDIPAAQIKRWVKESLQLEVKASGRDKALSKTAKVL
jgi:hypothetical protein